jgi:hypothetical protein
MRKGRIKKKKIVDRKLETLWRSFKRTFEA